MIPWDKMPKRVQRSILAMILFSGTSSIAGCSPPPVICDPVPPPPTTPAPTHTPTPAAAGPTIAAPPSFTPIICDPMPPPKSSTPTRTPSAQAIQTPMICDPPPNPPVRSSRSFRVRTMTITSDPSVGGANIRGRVLDAQGRAVPGVQITAISGTHKVYAGTNEDGSYSLDISDFGAWRIYVGDDQPNGVTVTLQEHDQGVIDWVMDQSQSWLPLAEIRTVEIVALGGGRFRAKSPWPNARLRWTASGGVVTKMDDGVVWDLAPAAGRYLLQVVADWGREGLAVKALVVAVDADGTTRIV